MSARLDYTGKKFGVHGTADMRCISYSLAGKNFTSAVLDKAVFSGGSIAGACFRSAKMRGITMGALYDENMMEEGTPDATKTDFSWADLTGSDLSGTNFTKADFTGAILRHVNLARSDLSRAKLSGADLSYANLSGARMVETILDEACFDHVIIFDLVVRGTVGSPRWPHVLYLDPKRKNAVRGQEAHDLLVRPALVEVVLDRPLSDVVLGAYHMFITECRVNGCWPPTVAYLGGRVDDSYTYLQYQAPTAVQVTSQLAFLLSPFRLAAAVRWDKANQHFPQLSSGSAELSPTTGARLPSLVAARLQNFAGFADAAPLRVDYPRRSITLEMDPATIASLRPGVVFAPKLVLIEGRINMSEKIEIQGDVIGGAVGNGAIAFANDITVYKNHVDSSAKLDLELKEKLKEARALVEELKLTPNDTADVLRSIAELTKLMESDKPEPSLVRRYWERIEQVAPTIAAVLSAAASIATLLA